MSEERPPIGNRIFVAVWLAALAAGGAFLEFLALFAAGMRCDDRCGGDAHWSDSPDSWQWEFQFYIATAGFLMLLAAVGLALAGRYRATRIAVIGGACTFAGWWAFLTG